MQAVLWLLSSFTGWQVVAGYDKMVGGGILTDISKTPYVVSIHLNETVVGRNGTVPPQVLWNPICSGTIFTAAYVITACHCVVGEDAEGQVYSLVDAYPLEKWAFLAGAWDLHIPAYELNAATQRRTPESIRHHPKCHPERTPWLLNDVPINDVAVAKMAVPYKLDHYVKPVKIFGFDRSQFKKSLDAIINDKIHMRCTVAGWGSTWDKPIAEALNLNTTTSSTGNCAATLPDEDRYKLKYIRMQARYEEDCLNALVLAIKKYAGQNVSIYWPAFEEKFREKLRNQICATNKNASPCRGDSGSGLICDNHFIIGINSFGIGCGSSAPDVFQSVLPILDWLEQEVCSVRTCTDVQHLHSNCNIQTQADLAVIEKCQTTPPKNRNAPATGIPSSVTPIVKTRWLITVLAAITY